jgi:hypothetical protein
MSYMSKWRGTAATGSTQVSLDKLGTCLPRVNKLSRAAYFVQHCNIHHFFGRTTDHMVGLSSGAVLSKKQAKHEEILGTVRADPTGSKTMFSMKHI